MNEIVPSAGMDPGFGGHFSPPFPFLPEGDLKGLNDIGHREFDGNHVLLRKIENFLLGHKTPL
jgi:hypothetical protein